MDDRSRTAPWLRRLALLAALVLATLAGGWLYLSRADGPVGVFAGGPLRSGELADFAAVDWWDLDRLHDLELELVGEGRSRTLWFSTQDGIPYVACDLDCVGGVLERWPQQVERDDRVVVRIDGRRVLGRLVHVPHGTAEYASARAGRERKFSGDGGGLAAAETAAHNAVVDVGEKWTGRDQRAEPGDRLFRIDPR
ncbi:MAG: hypothetical protein IPK00_18150 [Deltaproteobacteria bacterium]|nr:hypothetical protein [Deltaproteobacteria bacterium]